MKLRSWRVENKLTIAQAAKALDISKETLGHYENGKSFPRVDLANKMAELYNCEIQDIDFLLP